MCSKIFEAHKDDIAADNMPSSSNESPTVPCPYILSDVPHHAFDDAFDDGIREHSSNLEGNDLGNGNSELKNLRLKNVGRLVVGYLNIISVRNKFEGLKDFVSDHIDVLMVAETKIDNSFPKGQFFIQGYSELFRLDRNSNGGGLLVYVKEDIPSKQLKSFKFEDGQGANVLQISYAKMYRSCFDKPK